MHTAIIRGIIYRSITILSIFVLLSGCHHSSSGHKSEVNVENANITNLTLSSGTLSPVFDVNTTSYTAQVANNVSSITATMTAADSTSTITVNGQTVNSGAASQAINLSVGANTITIVVTSEDKTTTKTYSVVVARIAAVLSSNANLSGLSLSTGTLSPTFASQTTGYTALVANSVSSITVTPTAADSTATITVNGVKVSSGAASQSINLSVGANTITIVVTAQNGTTKMTYAVVVSRLAPVLSSNDYLAGLSLSTGSALSPTFTSKTTGYTAQVVYAITSITVTPTAADSTSTITVNGQAVSSGAASQSINLSVVGANPIAIVVTAQNGTTLTYAIVVSRLAASNNANLAGLSLPTGSTLSPAFTYSTTSYTGQVPDNILSIKITPTAADSTSTIAVNGVTVSSGAASQSIDVSSNTIIIVVTAQDGATTKTYTVTIEQIRAFLWMSGDKIINQSGVYTGAASEYKPGARDFSVSWIDSNGNLWLFGGYGYDGSGNLGYLNDLWKFDGANWIWVSGYDTDNQIGVYGSLGVAAASNIPGARWESVSWIDSNGNLWLFGGYGYDGSGNLGYLNDLWKFDGANWTWVSGSNTVKQYGVYGTIKVAGGIPGSRASSVSWKDSSGNLWLFGGWGYDSTGNLGDLNDLWKFDGTNWTWVSGSYSYNQSGVYGTQGVAAAANKPGGRDSSISWIDSSNNLWLFGGNGFDTGVVQGLLNDLWKFNGTYWIWVSGDSTHNKSGVYTGAASAFKPGARWGSVSWIDSKGIFWLFGGSGYDATASEGYLSDLWEFDCTYWTWVSGDITINQSGVYGTATSWNKPGSRSGSISWIDKSGNLWFFGGLGYDSAGNLGDLNDLWQYK